MKGKGYINSSLISKKTLTKAKIRTNPDAVIKLLAATTILLTTVNIAIQIAIYCFGLKKEWFLLFNMDKEVNIPTLFSVILLLICALLISLIHKKLNKQNKKVKKRWSALRWIFIFLSLDEGLQIHEAFAIPSLKPMLPAFLSIVWIIPYGIFATVALIYFMPLINSLPTKLKLKTLLSGAVYLLGALGFEIIGSGLVRTGDIKFHGISYGLITTIEEALEMAGLIIFIHTLLRYIFDYQRQKLRIDLRLASVED